MGDLFAVLNKQGKSIAESPVKPENLGRMVDLINDGTISSRIAKDVFAFMVEEGKTPDEIVEEKGLKQVTDTSAIEKWLMTLSRPIRTKSPNTKAVKKNCWAGSSARR